jgi:hypothetical protein
MARWLWPVFAWGQAIYNSELGTDPLHAMIIGIVGWLDVPFIKVDVVELFVVVLTLGLWCAWNRTFPLVTLASVFLTIVSVGFLIDLWNALHLEELTGRIKQPWLLANIGFVLDSYASVLIIVAGFGIRSWISSPSVWSIGSKCHLSFPRSPSSWGLWR